MASKLVLFLLISSSCFPIGMCQNPNAPPPCMKSLVPCKPYLHGDDMPPPECCVPLKQLMKSDMKCLCQIFNNPQILAGFNLTHDQAIKLPTHCDKNADLSTCGDEGAATPASAPGSSSNSSAPASSAAGSSGSATASTPAAMDKNGADKMMSKIQFGGLCLVAVLGMMMII